MSEKQLLLESCDFSFTCNLSEEEKNTLTESLKISAGKNGNLIVKSIPCTILDRRNQNGRIYPTALMQKAINEARPKMKAKMLLCSYSEHPQNSFPEPKDVSHCVINAYIKNVEIEVEGKKERHNVLFNDWEILNEKSQAGAQAQQLLLSGFGIGTSIRSLGSCDPDGTVTELSYLGTDLVGQPSSETFVNSVIGESVSVSVVPENTLTETYVVSASATNVVRDLDSALALSQQIDSANFGTVKKTSTKLDSEVDPKTGAETTMVTLETETEDEVSDIDQALMMAKQAMMNGKADIDSVTIENVKEEQPKESAENSDAPILNEEEKDPAYLALKKSGYYSFNTPEEYMQFINDNAKYLDNGYSLPGAEKIFAEYTDGKISPELACHELEGFIGNITNKTFGEYVLESAVEPTITEAKEDKQEDPNNGKQFVLKTNQGFVAMDGNALKFVEKPKDAIHFVKGKEESGVIHLSGIEKILDTMGVYDVEKYYKKGTTDISVHDDVNVLAVNTNSKNKDGAVEECSDSQATMTEDNGSNTKYQAVVEIVEPNGSRSSETIPVSAVDMEGINKEIGNLYDMKSQNGSNVNITVVDTATGQSLVFNKDMHQVEAAQMESAGDLEQNGNKLSMEVDDDNKVEKEFKTPAQAAVAKAGIESGKFGGDVLLSEEDDDDEDETDPHAKCEWCGEEYALTDLKREKDLGLMCPVCRRAVASRVSDPLEFSDVKMNEVMYNEPGEASDPYIEKPLNEDDTSSINVTFRNIDWNNEDLMNKMVGNMEDDDPVNIGDIESKVKDLPDEATITVRIDEIPMTDDASLERFLFDKLGEKYAMKVNNAEMADVNWVA